MGHSSCWNILLQHESCLCRTPTEQYVVVGLLSLSRANLSSDLLNPNVDAMVDDREDSILNELTASSRSKSQKDASALQSTIEKASEDEAEQRQTQPVKSQTVTAPAMEGAAELEEEAEGEAAFNPVTGEINWDCPCLGGMAYGPCGPEFREAFSCFVYSTQEPKGMECIDKFSAMQNCFRAHPEHYKGELEDDETIDAELAHEKEELQKEIAERRAALEAHQQQGQSVEKKSTTVPSSSGASADSEKSTNEKTKTKTKKQKPVAKTVSEAESSPQPEAKTKSHTPEEFSQEKESQHGVSSTPVRQPKTVGVSAEADPESETLVPKAAHDATDMSSGQSHSKAI